MAISVSVIICTYNGAKKIPELMDALQKQTVLDFELVIVIDGSVDNTREVVELYNRSFQFMRVVNQPNQGRSKAKNRGALESSGGLLIFYDDDMTPIPKSVERHIMLHVDQKRKIV